MRRNRYVTTGLAVLMASLVLAGCSSADDDNKTGKTEKVEKVEKVEKTEKVEKVEVEKEKEGKAKP